MACLAKKKQSQEWIAYVLVVDIDNIFITFFYDFKHLKHTLLIKKDGNWAGGECKFLQYKKRPQKIAMTNNVLNTKEKAGKYLASDRGNQGCNLSTVRLISLYRI